MTTLGWYALLVTAALGVVAYRWQRERILHALSKREVSDWIDKHHNVSYDLTIAREALAADRKRRSEAAVRGHATKRARKETT
jgi:hypothetical protein